MDWISIKEREPGAQHVLVTLDWGDGDYEVTEVDYGMLKYSVENGDPNDPCVARDKMILDKITGWAPMPEPYTGA